MWIEHLREFLVLADTLSFSRTAKQLYMAQSVISKHIAAIEKELDTKLFIRDSHHVRLTNAGQIFQEEAQSIIASYDSAVMKIDALKESYDFSMDVGYLRSATHLFLVDVKRWFLRKKPDVKIQFISMEHGELMNALLSKKIDIALTLDVDPDLHDVCEAYPIYEDCLHAIVSYDNPLAGLPEIRVETLLDEYWVLPDSTHYTYLYKYMSKFFPQIKPSLIKHRYHSIDDLFLSVESNEGVGFASGHHKPLFEDKVCFIPLIGQECYFFSAMWLKGTDKRKAELCIEAITASGSKPLR